MRVEPFIPGPERMNTDMIINLKTPKDLPVETKQMSTNSIGHSTQEKQGVRESFLEKKWISFDANKQPRLRGKSRSMPIYRTVGQNIQERSHDSEKKHSPKRKQMPTDTTTQSKQAERSRSMPTKTITGQNIQETQPPPENKRKPTDATGSPKLGGKSRCYPPFFDHALTPMDALGLGDTHHCPFAAILPAFTTQSRGLSLGQHTLPRTNVYLVLGFPPTQCLAIHIGRNVRKDHVESIGVLWSAISASSGCRTLSGCALAAVGANVHDAGWSIVRVVV
ncbi:MAG: hypothetical protein Q9199_002972 [Rusavskia elegans]